LPVYRLAHLSDLHLPADWTPATLGELFSKRATSRFAWRRKRRRHSTDILAALVADVAAWAPDHIALTGDLTNFSTPEEFAEARTWLSSLGGPDKVTVSPGNHDALVAGGLKARFAGLRPWFGDGGEDFPYVRRRGPAALINLCSAEPTPLHLATGRLGPAQLERLDALLETLGREGAVRILMLHHPVSEGVVSGRKSLTDRRALREVIVRRGAELVLHGHAHEQVFATLPGPHGAVVALGAPSASSAMGGRRPARWHAIEVSESELRIQLRGYDALSHAVVELGRFALPVFSAGIAA
jgi:3',5'-cyclic AMP phosphodiesterase CpdA